MFELNLNHRHPLEIKTYSSRCKGYTHMRNVMEGYHWLHNLLSESMLISTDFQAWDINNGVSPFKRYKIYDFDFKIYMLN